MRVLALEKFYKTVPKDKKEQVNDRVKAFLKEIEDNKHNYLSVSKGYGSKKVESIEQVIYKFTVGRSDRILYTYGSKLSFIDEKYRDSIVLLEYCDHDNQIRTARDRNFTKQKVVEYLIRNPNQANEAIEDEELIQLSFEDSITKIFSVEQMNDVFGEEGFFYHLDREQNKVVQLKDKGEIVFGSAGSGKTTIGVYKLVEFLQTVKNHDIRISYFTFSKRLKDRTEKFFEKLALELYGISRDEFRGKVDFFTVEQYLEQMSDNQSKIITYEKFVEWYNEYQPAQFFDASALWKERRGIFQGMIGADWQYKTLLPSADFDQGILQFLQMKQFINWNMQNKSFQFKKDLNAICVFLEDEYGNAHAFRQQVIHAYNGVISAKKQLTLQEYLDLNEDYTLFTREEQEKVCKHFNNYDPFVQQLRRDGYREEGELVRAILPKTQPIYDYIIIDEVQDLTELQVYYLCQLLKSKKNVYISGDFYQTINPTFFKIGRMESIFKFLGGMSSFDKKTLQHNYRSSKDIVDFANELALLREESFTSKLNSGYTEIAVRDHTKKPFLYESDQEKLFNYVKDKSYISIVVGNTQTKDDLKQKYPDLESSILTVSEIKGIERKYIITYNLLSDYKLQWTEIFRRINENSKLQSELYRYYFNIFYVGITRARDVLGMVEDDLPEGIKKWLIDKVDVITKFDVVRLDLQEESTIDDHLAVAQELEEDSLYIDAIARYKKLLGVGNESLRHSAEIGIKRCEIMMKFSKDRNYTKCGESLLALEQYDKAVPYLQQGKNAKALLISILNSTVPERFNMNKEMMKLKTNPLSVLSDIGDEILTKRYIQNEIKPFSARMDDLVEKSTKVKDLHVTIIVKKRG